MAAELRRRPPAVNPMLRPAPTAEAQAPPSAAQTARDRSLAMVGYALSVAALFTFWLTGLAAFLLALSRRKSPDPVARAHFRYQLWVADLAGLAVGVAAALGVSALILVGSPLFDGDWPTLGDFGGAAGLVAVGLALWAASTAGTVIGAAFGVWRLLNSVPPIKARR